MEEYDLKLHDDFNYDKWLDDNKDFTQIIAGKRRSGKSVLTKWMIKYYFLERFGAENIILFKGSYYDDEFYNCYLPDENIMRFELETFFKLVEYQKILHEKKTPLKILYIFDDCNIAEVINDKLVKKKFIEIFVNGRHFGASLNFISQYSSSLPPIWLANTDLIFALNVLSENFVENIRRNFASYYPKTKFVRRLKQVYDEKKHQMLLFDNETRKIYKFLLDVEIVKYKKKVETDKYSMKGTYRRIREKF